AIVRPGPATEWEAGGARIPRYGARPRTAGADARSIERFTDHVIDHSIDHLIDHLARRHTMFSVTPAGVRGFVNLMSSAPMDVTTRRWLGAPIRFGNVLVSILT